MRGGESRAILPGQGHRLYWAPVLLFPPGVSDPGRAAGGRGEDNGPPRGALPSSPRSHQHLLARGAGGVSGLPRPDPDLPKGAKPLGRPQAAEGGAEAPVLGICAPSARTRSL